MSVLVEIVHRIEPGTPNRFADYVTRYGECAIPALERCGYDVLGGWKWSTGELFSDLVLARFDSLADYEAARFRAAAELRRAAHEPRQTAARPRSCTRRVASSAALLRTTIVPGFKCLRLEPAGDPVD